MCGSTTHLGKGTRCAPPLHPLGHDEIWVLNPVFVIKTYRRFTTRRAWRFPSPPAPNHGSKSVSPPLATLSREMSLSLHPSIKGRSCPCEILTNPARIGCRQPIDAEPEHEAIAPLLYHSQVLEICHSNLHPTMHERLPVQLALKRTFRHF